MVSLTMVTWDYDRVQPIFDGRVKVQGVDLTPLVLAPEEAFFRMARFQDIDLSEFSLSSYVISVSRGNSPFVAIPVFLSRVFRHSCIFVRSDSGIEKPEQLAGRRVGVPEYQITAAVWERAFIQHDYGVHPSSIKWVTGGEEQPGRDERVPMSPPPGVSIEPAPHGKSLTGMLLDGELDAMFCARPPSAFVKKDPRIKRLFPKYRTVEEDYYKRTGIFPIMHVMVFPRKLYDKYPWLGPEVYKAFEEAKKIAEENIYDISCLRTTLPWLVAEAEAEREFFGGDPWTYGIDEKNRAVLDAFLNYHYEQGLSERRVKVEELFAPNTLEQSLI